MSEYRAALSGYRNVLGEGLWSNNPGLVQLLGLCPLLAVTNTAVNGLALGLATAAVLIGSNVAVSVLRGWIAREVRIPAFVLIIASLVTAVELVMHGYFPELYGILGIFIPLIVTNCTILARAEAFASRNPPLPAAADGLAMGAGFAGVLVTLGALRELVGRGTLLADAELLFGPAAAGMTLHLQDYPGFLLAVLPPGAFFGLAGLVALKKVIDERAQRRAPAEAPAEAPTP